MRIGLTGITGFIGTRIAQLASQAGHEIVGFSRNAATSGLRRFSESIEPDVSGLDAIIHLAGEPILGLWTQEKKRRIRSSRVDGTQMLVRAISKLPSAHPRPALISCSAVGYYGNCGDTQVEETHPPGTDFLAETSRDWETAALAANQFGSRVAVVRVGFVLGRDGGAFPLLRRVFRLGLGGRLGPGTQWMPVVHVDDVAALFLHLALDPMLSGAFNATGPTPVTNSEFTHAIATSVHRPALFPVPAAILKLLPGGLGSLFLDSMRVSPARTLESGFRFQYPELAGMLGACVETAPR